MSVVKCKMVKLFVELMYSFFCTTFNAYFGYVVPNNGESRQEVLRRIVLSHGVIMDLLSIWHIARVHGIVDTCVDGQSSGSSSPLRPLSYSVAVIHEH